MPHVKLHAPALPEQVDVVGGQAPSVWPLTCHERLAGLLIAVTLNGTLVVVLDVIVVGPTAVTVLVAGRSPWPVDGTSAACDIVRVRSFAVHVAVTLSRL